MSLSMGMGVVCRFLCVVAWRVFASFMPNWFCVASNSKIECHECGM